MMSLRVNGFNALALVVAVCFSIVPCAVEASVKRQVLQATLGSEAVKRANQKCQYFAPPEHDYQGVYKNARKMAKAAGLGVEAARDMDVEYWADYLCDNHPSKRPDFRPDAFLSDRKWQVKYPQLAETAMAIEVGDKRQANNPLAQQYGGNRPGVAATPAVNPAMTQQGAGVPAPQGWTAAKPAPQAAAGAQAAQPIEAAAQPATPEGAREVGTANFEGAAAAEDKELGASDLGANQAAAAAPMPRGAFRTETHYVTRSAAPQSLLSTNTLGGFFIGVAAGVMVMYVYYEKISKVPGEIKFSAAGLPVSKKPVRRDVPSSALD